MTKQLLGYGSFGRVFLKDGYVRKIFGEHCKQCDSSISKYCLDKSHYNLDDEFENTSFFTELTMIQKFQNHPYIIKCIHFECKFGDFKYIDFEYMKGDLTTFFSKTTRKERIDCFPTFCKQIFSAISFLHENGYSHRDIKVHNILYNYDEDKKEYIFKLCDFGMVRNITKGYYYSDTVGSFYYTPPELWKRLFEETKTDICEKSKTCIKHAKSSIHDSFVDCWSLGIVCIEFFIGRCLSLNKDNMIEFFASILPFEKWFKKNQKLLFMANKENINTKYIGLSNYYDYLEIDLKWVEMIELLMSPFSFNRISLKQALNDYFYISMKEINKNYEILVINPINKKWDSLFSFFKYNQRDAIINWLCKLQDLYSLSIPSFCMIIDLLDCYIEILSKNNININIYEIQKIASSVIYTISCIYDYEFPSCNELSNLSKNDTKLLFNNKELLETCYDIITKVNGKLPEFKIYGINSEYDTCYLKKEIQKRKNKKD